MVFSADQQREVPGPVEQLQGAAHLPVGEAIQRQVCLQNIISILFIQVQGSTMKKVGQAT